MKSNVNTQRVNAAVGVAVRRAISEMSTIGNRQALEVSIGRRLQGTYGAELRRVADLQPDLSAAELAEGVIFPAEYPDDATALASVHSGDRDRARRVQPNAASPVDFNWHEPAPDGWRAGLDTAKASLVEPVRVQRPKPVYDPRPQVTELRAALDAGKVVFQQGRRQRLDAARERERTIR